VAGARHLVEVAVLEGLETRLAEDGVMVAPCGVGAIDVDARVELSKELSRDAEGSGARERLADGNLLLLDQGRILAQNDLCVLSPAILVSNTFLTSWRRRTGKHAAFEEREARSFRRQSRLQTCEVTSRKAARPVTGRYSLLILPALRSSSSFFSACTLAAPHHRLR
jgi:hypothetical protein